jgi:flagellin-like protein
MFSTRRRGWPSDSKSKSWFCCHCLHHVSWLGGFKFNQHQHFDSCKFKLWTKCSICFHGVHVRYPRLKIVDFSPRPTAELPPPTTMLALTCGILFRYSINRVEARVSAGVNSPGTVGTPPFRYLWGRSGLCLLRDRRKQGISEIVATLLMIVVVVSIGVTVLGF